MPTIFSQGASTENTPPKAEEPGQFGIGHTNFFFSERMVEGSKQKVCLYNGKQYVSRDIDRSQYVTLGLSSGWFSSPQGYAIDSLPEKGPWMGWVGGCPSKRKQLRIVLLNYDDSLVHDYDPNQIDTSLQRTAYFHFASELSRLFSGFNQYSLWKYDSLFMAALRMGRYPSELRQIAYAYRFVSTGSRKDPQLVWMDATVRYWDVLTQLTKEGTVTGLRQVGAIRMQVKVLTDAVVKQVDPTIMRYLRAPEMKGWSMEPARTLTLADLDQDGQLELLEEAWGSESTFFRIWEESEEGLELRYEFSDGL